MRPRWIILAASVMLGASLPERSEATPLEGLESLREASGSLRSGAYQRRSGGHAEIVFVLKRQGDGRVISVLDGCLCVDAEAGVAIVDTQERVRDRGEVRFRMDPVDVEWQLTWDVTATGWIDDRNDPRVVASGSRRRSGGGTGRALTLCRGELEALARIPADEFVILFRVKLAEESSKSLQFVTGADGTPQLQRTFIVDKERVTRARIAEALARFAAETPSAVGTATRRVNCGQGVFLEMVEIGPGAFMMGSPSDEAKRDGDELRHQVTISEAFLLGRTEVTQAQWVAVMGPMENRGTIDPQRPVDYASWDDAQEFCRRLSQSTGMRVRLPTEAEWEYACRAGSADAYAFGGDVARLNEYGWFDDNAGEETRRVATKRANAWGLYDMHGNVWEWCSDWYNAYVDGPMTDPQGPPTGTARVQRGGSAFDGARYCRSAYRGTGGPGLRIKGRGFRIASSL